MSLSQWHILSKNNTDISSAGIDSYPAETGVTSCDKCSRNTNKTPHFSQTRILETLGGHLSKKIDPKTDGRLFVGPPYCFWRLIYGAFQYKKNAHNYRLICQMCLKTNGLHPSAVSLMFAGNMWFQLKSVRASFSHKTFTWHEIKWFEKYHVLNIVCLRIRMNPSWMICGIIIDLGFCWNCHGKGNVCKRVELLWFYILRNDRISLLERHIKMWSKISKS